MQFNVLERVLLLNILPAEGNVVSLRICHNLRMALSFSEEEMERYGIKVDAANGRVEWTPEAAACTKDVEVGPQAFVLIAETLDKLSKQNRLHADHLGLYDRVHEEKAV